MHLHHYTYELVRQEHCATVRRGEMMARLLADFDVCRSARYRTLEKRRSRRYLRQDCQPNV